ncbi:CidA/LrgA family protein [Bradyrhizobium genosp. A]|uniref:CidA/LrgA family protein n=1 Tax=Bradyrhizobium genosp. A TaxID=83626 RepID=UPI003CE9B9B3
MIQSPLIQGLGTLLGFQLAGELLVRLLQVPIPGPIIGLSLLFLFLRARIAFDLAAPDAIEATAVARVTDPMLRNLAILFVPSGVGVLQYADLFVRHGAAVVIVVMVSTLTTMTVTALVFVAAQSLVRRLPGRSRASSVQFGPPNPRRSG